MNTKELRKRRHRIAATRSDLPLMRANLRVRESHLMRATGDQSSERAHAMNPMMKAASLRTWAHMSKNHG